MSKIKYSDYLRQKYSREDSVCSKDVNHEMLLDIALGNRKLHEEHLKQQDSLLKIIQKQSKPQLWRETFANVLGNIVTDGGTYILKKIIK